MDTLVAVCVFALGAVFGSFAGAVAWRLKKKKDFVRGRSECEACHHQLAPSDLVPIVSWLALRGRCRYCKKPIGATALVVELSLGVAFLLSYQAWPYGLETITAGLLFGLWLVVLVMFAILCLYDARWSLLPDKVVYPLIGVSVLFFIGRVLIVSAGATPFPFFEVLTQMAYALLPIAGVYGLLYIISAGKWVGFGDVKLGIALGLLLGWQNALLALVLANLIGFIFVLPGLASQRLDKTSHVPFGPFLIVATFIAFLYGQYLIDAYLKLLIM